MHRIVDECRRSDQCRQGPYPADDHHCPLPVDGGSRTPHYCSETNCLLKKLNWRPVNYRIKSKPSTLTYRAVAIHQPPYLASLLYLSNIPRQLRSSTTQQLYIPRTKLNLGKRAFSVAAPIIWNELLVLLLSSSFGFSHQGSTQRFSISGCFYGLYSPPSLQPQPRPLSPHPST